MALRNIGKQLFRNKIRLVRAIWRNMDLSRRQSNVCIAYFPAKMMSVKGDARTARRIGGGTLIMQSLEYVSWLGAMQ